MSYNEQTSAKHFTALHSHSAQLVNAIYRHVSLAVLPLVVGFVGLALNWWLGLGRSGRLLIGGVHLLHNWLRLAGLLHSWGLVVEVVVREYHENIMQPALVLLGSSNTIRLLEIRSRREG